MFLKTSQYQYWLVFEKGAQKGLFDKPQVMAMIAKFTTQITQNSPRQVSMATTWSVRVLLLAVACARSANELSIQN